jgi:cobalt-zinc-cadmium efflux system membrane fusion protein
MNPEPASSMRVTPKFAFLPLVPRLFLLLVVSGLSGGGCRSAPASQVHLQPPSGEVWLTPKQVRDSRVTVAPVANQLVDNVVTASGHVGFDDLRVAHIFSPVTGKVTRILAAPGQRVKQGAPLAIIQSPDVGNAFSDLGKAQADLIAAEHDFHRQQELYQAHAGSQKDSEAAEDNFRKAKAEMDRARQKARLFRGGSADAVTQEFTLRAPIDGEIVARNVNPGAEVQGQYSGGTAVELFTVGELDRVWVTADIFEMDLGRVKKGAPVTIKAVAYPDRTFTGVVDWISDTLDPVSRTARVRCAIANPDRELKPEMYATVDIEVAGVATPALPRSAVLRISDQTIVFIADGQSGDGRQRFIRRVVALDEDRGNDVVPIVRGLALGERVVTSGGILLSALL